MLNKVILMGRIVRDPELRYTTTKKPVTSFTIACQRDMQGKNGEQETDFVDCVAWNNTAEFASKYFTKGQLCVVVGRLQFRDWTDKNGNKRKNTEIVLENMYFAEHKRDAGNGDRESDSYSKHPKNYTPKFSDYEDVDDEDDELPF